ncbi:MAG: carboxylesterase family protein [Pseudomonadales bacterium]|nr:carboxylesterase/lipase family protein [Pseudomonadales bacterium]
MITRLLASCALLILTGCGEAPPPPAAPAESTTASQATAAPIAQTIHGKVRGAVQDGVNVFLGIRYGADTATTRFAAPALPEPWSGVVDALEYGNSARQIPTGSGGGLFDSWARVPTPALDEDCLFLNVWSPALRDGGKRPVMVWFHGGGFSSGSGSSTAYEGTRLANRGDVVVVTVNHRLNMFAHLYLAGYGERFADSGNAGILDLIQSLEWVRDNIAEFGGDPDNVLIFGESGGGAKVSVLMAMDAAQGLFHRAVIQSGPRLTNPAPDVAAAGAWTLVEELGLTADTIDEITTMAPERIEAAAAAVVAAGGNASWNGPVYDGRNFTREPFEPDAPPQSASVPLLIGTTRTEMSLLAGARRPELFELTWDTLPAAIGALKPGVDANAIIAGYRALDPAIDAPELYFTAATDNGFLRGSVTLADRKAMQAGAPVYAYLFNWNTPVDGGKWRSPHALEIGFVFDNVANSASMSGLGDEQQRIADMMSEAWIAFARSGDPNNANLPKWEPYTAEQRATMVIDTEAKLIDHPRGPYLSLLGD